jgi:hypothetical protein
LLYAIDTSTLAQKSEKPKIIFSGLVMACLLRWEISSSLVGPFPIGDKQILKTIGIYGPNNAGKTCFLRALFSCLAVANGNSLSEFHQKLGLSSNWFSQNTVSTFEIGFVQDNRYYTYSFGFDFAKDLFVAERIVLHQPDKDICVLSFSPKEEPASEMSKKARGFVKGLSHAMPALYSINTVDEPRLAAVLKDFHDFSENVLWFLREGYFDDSQTLSLMKNGGALADKVKAFVKQADLSLTDFYYNESDAQSGASNARPGVHSKAFHSVYGDKDVFSMDQDSRGTQKIEALAGYVIAALERGSLLLLDELDASLFYKLSRSIVGLFNNIANTKAQMLFTSHDLNLMDTRRLLRKDQLYFANRNKGDRGVSLIPLSHFTAKDFGVRSSDNIAEKYAQGELEDINLPQPEFVSILLGDGEKHE